MRLANQTADQRQYKVLVADDDEFMHAIIKVSLRKTNYLLAFVKNGVEALELIQTNPPDILIADGMMPLLSGFELVEDLKSRAETAGIPVILLTALDGSGGWLESNVKADLCLPKPFKVGSILDCLKKAERLVESYRTLRADAPRTDLTRHHVTWRMSY